MTQYQPKHMAPATYVSWRSTTRGRVLHTATAAVMAGLLSFPGSAFAADWIDVGEGHYESADGAASGEGWAWDGAYELGLNGYNGGAIAAEGNLNVTLEGENTITTDNGDPGVSTKFSWGDDGEVNENGDLTFKGDGSLTVDATNGDAEWASGVITTGNITVDGATVEVNATADTTYVNKRAEDQTPRAGSAIGVESNAEQIDVSTLNNGNIVVKNGGELTVNVSSPDSEETSSSSIGIWTGRRGQDNYIADEDEEQDGVPTNVTVDNGTLTVNVKGANGRLAGSEYAPASVGISTGDLVATNGSRVAVNVSDSNAESDGGGFYAVLLKGRWKDESYVVSSPVDDVADGIGAAAGSAAVASRYVYANGGDLTLSDSTLTVSTDMGTALAMNHDGSIKNSIIDATGVTRAVNANGTINLVNSDIEAKATAEGARAIVATDGITVTEIEGVEVKKEEGVAASAEVDTNPSSYYYLASTSGSSKISGTHTGAASTKPNGVGYVAPVASPDGGSTTVPVSVDATDEQADESSTTTVTTGAKHLAASGGTAAAAAAAVPRTDDRTSQASGIVAMVGAAALALSGLLRRRNEA